MFPSLKYRFPPTRYLTSGSGKLLALETAHYADAGTRYADAYYAKYNSFELRVCMLDPPRGGQYQQAAADG
jgi:hypothetical protein